MSHTEWACVMRDDVIVEFPLKAFISLASKLSPGVQPQPLIFKAWEIYYQCIHNAVGCPLTPAHTVNIVSVVLHLPY